MASISGRRSHRKSRTGCLQCKRRKVKCDEAKPACRNCEVHGVPCSFSMHTPHGQTRLQSGDFEPLESIPVTSPPNSGLSDLAIFDLELLHHYVTSTCYTLSRVAAVQAVWRDQAPRVGFSMPFVLHALLAVSALHLARSDPARRAACISQAQIHHSTAIRAAVPMISDLTSANSLAMFLFSSLTCIFSCANVHEGSNFLVLFDEGHLSAWARLFRGTKAVIDRSNVDFREGMLGPIFMNGAALYAARRSAQTLEIGQTFVWELKQMIVKETGHNEQLHRVYQDALDELSRTLAVTLKPGQESKLESADVFVWILEVSDEFLELLRQETPIALIIFSYFCVCIRQIEWMWWTEGLSERLMTQLHTALDESYRGWLEWPQHQIGWKGL